MELRGSVVLVTGASAGIGTAIAERCSAAGARVLVHGRDPQRTRSVADRLGATPLVADLGNASAARTLAEEAAQVHGHIDAVVANAGVGWSGPFSEMSPAALDTVLMTDLLAPLHLVHAALPAMLARGSGAVVMVGSVAGRTGVAGEAAYAAAKAGIDCFAESLGQELAGSGVSVGTVVPGVVATDFFRNRGRPYRRRSPRPVPAGRVADAVVESLRDGRGERWVPAWLRLGAAVRAAAPETYRRLSLRFGEDVHPDARTDEESPGR